MFDCFNDSLSSTVGSRKINIIFFLIGPAHPIQILDVILQLLHIDMQKLIHYVVPIMKKCNRATFSNYRLVSVI